VFVLNNGLDHLDGHKAGVGLLEHQQGQWLDH
jgi:hypothetical protein